MNNRRLKPDDAPGRHRFEHQCEECLEWFPEKNIQIDHTVPCGSLKSHEDIGPFVQRMLAPESGYTKMCKPCHQIKTNEERESKKEKS